MTTWGKNDITSRMLVKLKSGGPLYRRVYEALRDRILRGEIAAGATLPGTRPLARGLGGSRIVTLAAFEQLAAEGYVEGTIGSGTRVAVQAPKISGASRRPRHPAAVGDDEISRYARRAERLAPHTARRSEGRRHAKTIDFEYAT